MDNHECPLLNISDTKREVRRFFFIIDHADGIFILFVWNIQNSENTSTIGP